MNLLTRIFAILLCVWTTVHAQDLAGKSPLKVAFSQRGGFYEHPLELRLEAAAGKIIYTLNGSEPVVSSSVYSKPIRIQKTQVVRARVLHGKTLGPVQTHSFFIKEPAAAIPVVSLSVEPGLLFDPVKGLFVQGPGAKQGHYRLPGANFWSNAEIAVGVEIFDPVHGCVHNSRSGMRLFGEISRLFPQKSLTLVSRKSYGDRRFDFPIFGAEGPKDFKYLVLRNGGSDFSGAHFRDALITRTVRTWDLDVQASRPARVYINGAYWGVYNFREKINRFFIAAHHDVHPDSLDILEHKFTIKKGSRTRYQRLLDFLENNDLSDTANFDWVSRQMELSNFMDHQIAQIYFDNRDAGGNIRFWRPRRDDGRWRWILFDTDWGMGLHDSLAYAANSLQFHTAPDGPAWPNPPWSTLMLRKLLENEGFKQAFLTRFADRLNTTLQPEAVIAHIDDFYFDYAPEMERHTQRWKLSLKRWEREVQALRTFARKRPTHMWRHLQEYFQTGNPVAVEIVAGNGGVVRINKHLEILEDFHGWYFPGLPLHLEAVAHYGYRFSHWEGVVEHAAQPALELQLGSRPIRLKPVFEPYQHPLCERLVINEICPGDSLSGDWVELYNLTRKTVSLKGFQLRDLKGHTHVLPDVEIGPKDYLVLCRDPERFRRAFPKAYNVAGPLSFGISKVEEGLFLYDARGAFIDSVQYRLEPAAASRVLSLNLPQSDNSLPDNWTIQPGAGTPNAPNPYFLESRIHREQVLVMQVGLAAGVLLISFLLYALRKKEANAV